MKILYLYTWKYKSIKVFWSLQNILFLIRVYLILCLILLKIQTKKNSRKTKAWRRRFWKEDSSILGFIRSEIHFWDYTVSKHEYGPLTTLLDRLYCTGNFLQNILSCYFGTIQDNETDDTPFESPIKQLLNLVLKVSVAVSKRQPGPCVWKSTTLSKIDFMPLSVKKFSVSTLESIAMFLGFLLWYIKFP